MSVVRHIPHIVLLGLLIMAAACTAGVPVENAGNPGSDLRASIRIAAQPYPLRLLDWEIGNLLTPVRDNSSFSSAELNRQISDVLREENINCVPPVNVRLTKPPLLLVVSPREKIQYLDRLLLSPDLSADQIIKIEEKVDALHLSSLVVEIGGFGAAYPAIVSPDMPLKSVISASVEEWTHQYLAFRPLGFLYLKDSLGFGQSPEVINMNETLAGIIADEVCSKVIDKYYKADLIQPHPGKLSNSIDFEKEMRVTRKTVDSLLLDGEVDKAESFMESRRSFFEQYGYRIRKLNQAYFAFHGIYGQDPCSVSTVYDEFGKLRSRYAKLSDFVRDMSAMTRYADVQAALSHLPE